MEILLHIKTQSRIKQILSDNFHNRIVQFGHMPNDFGIWQPGRLHLINKALWSTN